MTTKIEIKTNIDNLQSIYKNEPQAGDWYYLDNDGPGVLRKRIDEHNFIIITETGYKIYKWSWTRHFDNAVKIIKKIILEV